ncbi:hypothetical protein [Rhizobium tubonense]|uniref:Curlin n=1 Tax=Rhizobium tubonense TaxID=484088 RepID=A0A2W4C3U9_9HYPH|nr:hypothetical protein [Rhizobium tubonense]PZM08177.1 hypothetical protein CPY51_29595 [Rhizobium tubonense]
MELSANRYAKLLGGACIVASLLAAPAAKAAESLLGDSVTSTAVGASLMEPIQPYASNNGTSTTTILQLGANNYANADVTGQASLAVIKQSGVNNRATQAIDGNNSALLLVQGGSNNSVVQAAKGNNDFQLVGVSGNNNTVAYIQSGDNLAGALDVRNANNTTVVAIQTPQSGRFLMPTGISGLQNQNVVVVPGRMYVFPKSR